MNEEPKFDPITLAPLGWALVVVGLLATWALSAAQETELKHIADVAGAISPALTFLAVVLAIIGWFVTAQLNADLERDRRRHAREGTRRQVRTLLRAALAVLDPFFWSFKTLQLGDVKLIYQRHLERLNERETAADLFEPEYTALDGFLDRFGRMIAMAEQRETKPPAGIDPNDRDALRYSWVQYFSDSQMLAYLEDAVRLLGDNQMRQDLERMRKRAEEEEGRLLLRLQPNRPV